MEVLAMFGKKKIKTPEEKKVVCQECGLDCRDKSSLERHINWAHTAVIYQSK
jgi:uncharacterized C2H2 Zn-finger protein